MCWVTRWRLGPASRLSRQPRAGKLGPWMEGIAFQADNTVLKVMQASGFVFPLEKADFHQGQIRLRENFPVLFQFVSG